MPLAKAAEHIRIIDAGTWTPSYSSVYLLKDERAAIVETGLPTSAGAIIEGVGAAGLRPEDIDFIVVTHLHLDHAGSAGALARHFPRAEVLVHPLGVPHLVDPSRLLASSRRALGEFGKTFGLDFFQAVEPGRIRAVVEGDVIQLGRNSLRVMEMAGHAPHHICLLDSASNGVFVGDEAGQWFPQCDGLLLATSAPAFDLDKAMHSISRLKAMDPHVLYFSHFGVHPGPVQLLDRLAAKLEQWAGIVQQGVREKRTMEYLSGLLADDMKREAPFAPDWVHEQQAPLYIGGYLRHFKLAL